jgi:TonB-linked SusC/RagA family outer membrane protein
LDWEIIDGLHFKPSGSYYKSESLKKEFERFNPYQTTRPMLNRYNSYWQWMADAVLTYDLNIFDKHDISMLVGTNATEEESYELQGTGRNAATDNIPTLNASNTDDERTSSSLGSGTIASAFARLSYSFDEKYLFTGSFRVDGSSVFADGNRYAKFGSLSAGWNVHKEKFWKNLGIDKYVTTFKPRLSWGTSGNDNISLSATQGNYATGRNYMGQSGVQNTTLANNDLLWETTSSIDVGAEIGILNNDHNIYFDYYDKRTKDRLTGLPLPAQSGFGGITSNVGTIQNKGFEIGVNSKVIEYKGCRWDIAATFSLNRTYVLELPENGKDKNRIGGGTIYDSSTGKYKEVGGLAEGERLGKLWMFDMVGIYQTDAEAANAPEDTYVSGSKKGKPKNAGDAIWKDVDGNGVIDSKDVVYVGYASPDKKGSIINTIKYEGFKLRVVMNYALGHVISNGWRARMNGNARNRVVTSGDVTNGDIWWSKENAPYEGYNPSNAKYPRYNAASDWDNGYRNHVRQHPLGVNNINLGPDNTAYLSDGDYLSFSEVSLSYEFPKTLLDRTNFVKGLNLQFTMYNLGYITEFDGLTPEHNGGYEVGTYPRPFQVNFTTRITF